MAGSGEHGHIRTGFGDDDLGGPVTDARDCRQQFPGGAKRPHELIDPGIEGSDVLAVGIYPVQKQPGRSGSAGHHQHRYRSRHGNPDVHHTSPGLRSRLLDAEENDGGSKRSVIIAAAAAETLLCTRVLYGESIVEGA